MIRFSLKVNERPLNLTLKINAAFSSLCGLTMLAAAQPLAEIMGGHHPMIYQLLGLGLLLYALDMVLSIRKGLTLGKGFYFVMGDFSWVFGSAVLLIGWGDLLSTAGKAAVAITATIVLGFGIAQDVYLFRAHRANRAPA